MADFATSRDAGWIVVGVAICLGLGAIGFAYVVRQLAEIVSDLLGVDGDERVPSVAERATALGDGARLGASHVAAMEKPARVVAFARRGVKS